MSFADLKLAPPILKAIQACGYHKPTAVQAEAIPKALAGRDLIASAQTGTGKTAAFVLPTLQRLWDNESGRKKGPGILVLTPTRELADQVARASRDYGKFLPFKSVSIVGGMPYLEQYRSLAKKPQLLIATPGRLVDLINRGRIDLSEIQILVLDEADRMLDMGFIDDVRKISACLPTRRQTLLFAATMGREVVKLADQLLKNPLRVQIAARQTTNEHIEQRLHVADDVQHKNRMLRHLIADRDLKQAIIFSATRRDADNLARQLHAQGHAAAALHGDMKQNARNRTIRNLRCGKIRLLVATDVAARGLDVAGISHVINYDLPKFAEDYVHRIGRTGRAGASGIAISFASQSDRGFLGRIERYIGQTLPQRTIPGLEPKRPLPSMSAARTAGSKSPRCRPASSRGFKYASADGTGRTCIKPKGKSSSGTSRRPAKRQGPQFGEHRGGGYRKSKG